MKQCRGIVGCIICMILGVVLMVLGTREIVDSYWSGMGGGLIGVGVVRAIRMLRYSKDEAYRESVEIEETDERNRFIRNKAWACAGYLFVLMAAVASIGFKLLGQELLSMAAGLAVCMLCLLYWGSFLVLKKKY